MFKKCKNSECILKECEYFSQIAYDGTSLAHLHVAKKSIFNMLMNNYLLTDAIEYCCKYYKSGLINALIIPKIIAGILVTILGLLYSFIISTFFNIIFNKFLGVYYSIFSLQNLNIMTISIVGGYITQAFWSKELITKM